MVRRAVEEDDVSRVAGETLESWINWGFARLTVSQLKSSFLWMALDQFFSKNSRLGSVDPLSCTEARISRHRLGY